MTAVGRTPSTHSIGLDKIGVKLSTQTNKILINEQEKTSVGNVFAIGDVADGVPELTPSAIRAG